MTERVTGLELADQLEALLKDTAFREGLVLFLEMERLKLLARELPVPPGSVDT